MAAYAYLYFSRSVGAFAGPCRELPWSAPLPGMQCAVPALGSACGGPSRPPPRLSVGADVPVSLARARLLARGPSGAGSSLARSRWWVTGCTRSAACASHCARCGINPPAWWCSRVGGASAPLFAGLASSSGSSVGLLRLRSGPVAPDFGLRGPGAATLGVVAAAGYSPMCSEYYICSIHYTNFDPTYLTNGWELSDETYTPGKLSSRSVLGDTQIRVSLRSSRTPYIFRKGPGCPKTSSASRRALEAEGPPRTASGRRRSRADVNNRVR